MIGVKVDAHRHGLTQADAWVSTASPLMVGVHAPVDA